MESKLDSILNEMKNLNEKITEIENNMATKQDLEKVSAKVEGIKDQVAHAQEGITEIKTSVNRIEENEPQDILAVLDRIDKNLDDKDSDIVVLNKRLFQVESTLERIANQ